MTLRPLIAVILLFVILAQPQAVAAQEGTVWIQAEAQPTLAQAQERAQAYAALLPETAGFRLRSGWYGILLGPYPADEVKLRLDILLREGLVPPDSFIAYSRDLGPQFWPEGAASADIPVSDDPQGTALTDPAPQEMPEETRQQARDTEALLSPDARMELQLALQWFGHYQGAIDGDYGPGTRNAMASWQEAAGVDPTGVLTTRQRATVLAAYRDEMAAYGFASVTDDKAGIAVMLPLNLVAFDRYDPPFAFYRAKTPDAPQIVLISQPGDAAALAGLYDLLQTLKDVPLEGERNLGESRFRITGQSATTATTVEARLEGGVIKGWMLISTPQNADRDARILQLLKTTFAASSDIALDPGIVQMSAETRAGLVAGLQVRTPRLSRSGFFISADGAVLTTVEAVEDCTRITLDHTTNVAAVTADAALGLALLTPATPLSPPAFATFPVGPSRVGTEVTLAGYSYETRLPAPVLTFGTLEELTGLGGEGNLRRLSLAALPGDAGGPVLDGTGALIGMLLPATAPQGKTLPPNVAFALGADAIAGMITANGVAPVPADQTKPLLPADLTDRAMGMTTLVSCWD